MRSGKTKYVLALLATFLLLSIVWIRFSEFHSLNGLTKICNENIELRYRELLETNNEKAFEDKNEGDKIFDDKQIGLYKYTNNKMAYWNNSQIPVPENLKELDTKQKFIHLKNGYYLTCFQTKGNNTYLSVSLIKNDYEFQNAYLKNNFAKWLNLPENIELSTKPLNGASVVLRNQLLFSLKGDDSIYVNTNAANTITFALILLIITYLLFISISLKEKPFSLFFIFQLAGVLLLRVVMLYLKWPAFLYTSSLYDLQIFGNAQSFFNGYLGDVIINSVMLIWLVITNHYQIKGSRIKTQKSLSLAIHGILLFVSVIFCNQIIKSVVSNSTLSFDFLNLFSIGWLSYFALFPIVLSSIAVLILVKDLVDFSDHSFKTKIIFVLASVLYCAALQIFFESEYWLENWWLAIVFVAVLITDFFKAENNVISMGFLLLSAAVVCSSILSFYVTKNQQQDFQVLSYKLTERQDAVLESEFINLPEKIENNQQLKNLSQFIEFNGDKEFLQFLKQNFFFGYFDRYNIEFSMFDENCKPMLKTNQAILLNEGFFEDQIQYQSIKTLSNDLYFIDKYKQNARYIAKFEIDKNKLYVMLEPKLFEEVGTFPDLLLDQSQQKQNKFRNFSYAVYRGGINNLMYGDYSYPVYLNDTLKLINEQKNLKHHFLYPEENSTIIITTKTKGFSYYFTYNSYLFLFFSIIAYIGYLIYASLFSTNVIASSLTRRIQGTVILLLLLSITAVGITSTKLVSNQFENDNEKLLQEKTKTILSELSGQLQDADTITDVSKELIDLTIKKYAKIFNSDISLFGKSGDLYLTSQPRLYELGLAAPLVNATAFQKLSNDNVSSYCSKDAAGSLNYLSLYTPIYNTGKKLIGYLNLPYFAKQSVLTNELSSIISTLLNVYVILFIISIVSGLVLSGYITLPLRILKQQMAKVSLGTKNEAIKWQSEDEIGKLVSEYNLMIEKLENSADLLAKSERETAWREMAKQVAHEIKNPLTPMKLNLQYLQHVIKNNPEDFEDRFNKASNSIIEQIDTLANIATEFSNFAKLPGGALEKINLYEIIVSTAELFEKENKIKITCNLHSNRIIVLADKEQMLRVFNNLLKNAIQATSEVNDPTIEITSAESNTAVEISIKDNGCGIPDGLKPKLFTPNFTTKSTGSGLGLAMIKNILDTVGARIWFESNVNKGTCFFLEFKKAED